MRDIIFTGFFSPVDNPDVLNIAKAGGTIPVQWRLTYSDGTPVTNSNNFKVNAYKINCNGVSGDSSDVIEVYSAGSSGTQNLGNGYWQYNWQTLPKTAYSGQCYAFKVTLNDLNDERPIGNRPYKWANFQFK
jgi:hypothetical protein